MLEKFKQLSKKEIDKKEKLIKNLEKEKDNQIQKVERIQDRIKERKMISGRMGVFKGMISDESEESDEEPDPTNFENQTVTVEEFEFIQSKRKKIKLDIKKWVSEFQAKYKRMPTDADTLAIATDKADFDLETQKYLAIKLKLLKQ